MRSNLNLSKNCMYLITIVALLGAIFYLLGIYLEHLSMMQVSRVFPHVAILFVLWRYLGKKDQHYWGVFVGLSLCMVGDFVNRLPHMFIPGLLLFLLGHIGFIYSFYFENKRRRMAKTHHGKINVLVGVPFFIYGVLFYMFLFPHLGKMALPVGVYALVISCMGWQAMSLRACIRNSMSMWGMIGALSFIVSDSMYGVHLFAKPIHMMRYPIVLTYWFSLFSFMCSVLCSSDPFVGLNVRKK